MKEEVFVSGPSCCVTGSQGPRNCASREDGGIESECWGRGAELVLSAPVHFLGNAVFAGQLKISAIVRPMPGPCVGVKGNLSLEGNARLSFEKCDRREVKDSLGGGLRVDGDAELRGGSLLFRDCGAFQGGGLFLGGRCRRFQGRGLPWCSSARVPLAALRLCAAEAPCGIGIQPSRQQCAMRWMEARVESLESGHCVAFKAQQGLRPHPCRCYFRRADSYVRRPAVHRWFMGA